MNGYMNKKGISFELKGKVREYLEFIFKTTNYDKKEYEILQKLNKNLKNEVIMEAYGKFLMNMPKLKDNFTQKTLENLAFYMKSQTFSPEEYIYRVLIIFSSYFEIIFSI